MEEIIRALKLEGVEASIQVCWEYQKIRTPTVHIFNCSNCSSNEVFGFSEYATEEGVIISSKDLYPYESPQLLALDWEVHSRFGFTDEKGWVYRRPNTTAEWSSMHISNSPEKRRMWERISVHLPSHTDCDSGCILTLVQKVLSRCRGLNPKMVHCALEGFAYEVQTIVQEQQFNVDTGMFTASQWKGMLSEVGSERDAGAGGRVLFQSVESLAGISRQQRTSPHEWVPLHDFIVSCSLSGDDSGWEYLHAHRESTTAALPPHALSLYDTSRDSLSASSSSLSPGASPDHPRHLSTDAAPLRGVESRRRLWMRTVVRRESFVQCHEALRRFLAARPRGEVCRGALRRRSHYRKRWCDGDASLTDDAITISLHNNYQSRVSYGLRGCEVVLVVRDSSLSAQSPVSSVDTDKAMSDSEDGSESDTSGTSDCDSSVGEFLFGLRRLGARGCDPGGRGGESVPLSSPDLVCTLGATSESDRARWMDALAHQLAIVNLSDCVHSTYSQVFGPPHVARDGTLVLSGELGVRGLFGWYRRTLVLHSSCQLSCYKGNKLLREENIRDLRVRDCFPSHRKDECVWHFDLVDQRGRVVLALAAVSEEKRCQWVLAMKLLIGHPPNHRMVFRKISSQSHPSCIAQMEDDMMRVNDGNVVDGGRSPYDVCANDTTHYSYATSTSTDAKSNFSSSDEDFSLVSFCTCRDTDLNNPTIKV